MKKIVIVVVMFVLACVVCVSGCTSSDSVDTNYTEPETESSESEPSESSSSSEPTPTTDEYSGLKYPDEVESILTQFDHNYDGKIEFLDSDQSSPDGQEEYAEWAVYAGMSTSDSGTLTELFYTYDSNGDGYLDKYELDTFYEDYYNS